MTTQCINLRERFGRTYRIGRDPSYAAEHGSKARRPDLWLDLILCKHGQIAPYGGKMLLASTKRAGAVAKRLAALECVEITQNGNDGVNARFHVDDFRQVAAILKPRRRRRRVMSPEQREQFAEVTRKGLAALKMRRKHLAQSEKSTLESPAGG